MGVGVEGEEIPEGPSLIYMTEVCVLCASEAGTSPRVSDREAADLPYEVIGEC